MAEQHRCPRHGRPSIASRVRLRPDGTQEIEYLCEIGLAEERMSGRLGGGGSLFDEFKNERSRMLVDGRVEPGDKVAVDLAGDRLRFEVDEGAAPDLLRERKEEGTPEPAGSRA